MHQVNEAPVLRLRSRSICIAAAIVTCVLILFFGLNLHPSTPRRLRSFTFGSSQGAIAEDALGCFTQEVDVSDWSKSQKCWNDVRRNAVISTLQMLEELPLDHPAVKRFQDQKPGYSVLDLLPVTYQCDANQLKRVGEDGDGGKWMCTELLDIGKDDCHIFSLGSNGNFHFEESISKLTKGKCKIHTFDCTGKWSNRVTSFHSWCIGDKDEVIDGRTYKRLSTIAQELRIPHISLLKMDIEGFEWPVFASLKAEKESFLPKQILVEVHTGEPGQVPTKGTWLHSMIALMKDLDTMGYRVAAQERNPLCPTCSEYALIRE
ncbi:hypothetical protein SpCBS45565_g05743 [Spizellomyces sp. 'palustris']|nr:hypothetical protein SpCBS45565_g05743 [Spizellomyces sp. 'palustris']